MPEYLSKCLSCSALIEAESIEDLDRLVKECPECTEDICKNCRAELHSECEPEDIVEMIDSE